MRRWVAPLLLGLVLAGVAYQVALTYAPRALMAAAVRRVGAGGFNRMTFGPLATDKARAIVRPSPDLAYASCPFDLSAGPLLVEVPPGRSPYWSLSVFDARTDVAFVANNRDGNGGPIRLVVARRDQRVPGNDRIVRVDGARGIALVRVLVEDRTRFAPLDAERRRASCRTL